MTPEEVKLHSDCRVYGKEEKPDCFHLGEHQMLLSFNNDCGALSFYYWWNSYGLNAFEKWLKKQKHKDF